MDLIMTLILFMIFIVMSWFLTKKIKLNIQKAETVHGKTLDSLTDEDLKTQEYLESRKKVIEKLEFFLKQSKFFEPIADWRNENIYRYIFNDGCLYEFDEILDKANHKIGMDEKYLCFKQLSYKRVLNPVEFINKFSNEIGAKL